MNDLNEKLSFISLLMVSLIGSQSSLAAEMKIGKPQTYAGMTVSAVYLQSVTMSPMMPTHGHTDIHLEADIVANEGYAHGFGEGAWIPYLTITYTITKKDSEWSHSGQFMPMVASDGPHYGANIAMDGVGQYHLKYRIDPPPFAGFYRHTDKETAVAKWWEPIEMEWDFSYLGVGKKGGY